MSGYRRVNYYELCRLCVSSEGTKMHIFREEGRRRQLPSKIQMCLPLQVQEEDSLPKIICNQCVEKLESFFDFRKSCVNAEAMLESYFTSSRYSPEFIREGKVYVKDESPSKKKNQGEGEKSTVKVQTVAGPVSVDSLSSLVSAGSIQIISSPEPEGPRLPQYKCTLEMQPSSMPQVVESPSVSYSYHTNTSMAATNTTSTVTLLKTEDSTQTDHHRPENNQVNCHSNEVNHEPMDQETTTYYVRVPNTMEHSSSPGQSEGSEVVESDGLHQTITFAPNHGQDMLVHFGFNNKDKDQSNTATMIRTDERESIAQIGEFLRMKTAVVVENEPVPASAETVSMCDQCGKQFDSAEQQSNHEMNCPGPPDNRDNEHFPCDVCGKPFKRKEHLFQHRKLHTGERPYSCPTCGKSFSRKEHLVRHSVSHTGQKVHACDMCNKSFSRKDNLHKHRKTHGIAGPYVCQICGKSFVVKHYYIMHKASHGSPDSPDETLPYRCDICYKGFSIKQYLVTHKLRHNRKNVLNADSTTNSTEQQSHSEPENEPQEGITLSTVNTAAILPPNVIHHGTNAPLYQVTSGSGTTYLATNAGATSQLLENYRRLHASSS